MCFLCFFPQVCRWRTALTVRSWLWPLWTVRSLSGTHKQPHRPARWPGAMTWRRVAKRPIKSQPSSRRRASEWENWSYSLLVLCDDFLWASIQAVFYAPGRSLHCATLRTGSRCWREDSSSSSASTTWRSRCSWRSLRSPVTCLLTPWRYGSVFSSVTTCNWTLLCKSACKSGCLIHVVVLRYLQEFLDRRKMTEFGSLALVDEGAGDGDGVNISLPGVRRGTTLTPTLKPDTRWTLRN